MDREFIQIERSQGAWHLIFQKLHQIARANAGTQQVAKKPMNAIRNRYRDVLPIDDTRVKLDDEDNDYINANFVSVEEVNRRYILSQGPLQHTCPHFWQMIWEQKSAAIVMLNKCIERGMNKCFPYWPLAEDPPLEAGKFHIENLGTEEESCYRLSHLKLINTENDESRVIMHFHYTHWPDFGVPQNPDVFLEYLYAVRNGGCLSPDVGPVVVHCSAGIGRSGTFCLVDVILAKLEATRDLASVDLQQILLSMRRQRLGLIQTADQLRFSYIAVLQGALQDLELEPSNYDDLSDSEEDVPEEDSDEESDSDEDVPQEDRYPHLTRQYGRSQTYDADDDVPPPLPPRPPDTLNYSGGESEDSDEDRQGAPPPPPPNSLPPGPPSIHSPNEEEDDLLPKKMKLEQNHDLFSDLLNGEEYGFKLAGNDDEEFEQPQNSDTLEQHHNEEETATTAPPTHNSIDQQHQEEEQGEVQNLKETVTPPPPPVPPRSHSLSPSPNQTPYHDHIYGGAGASGGGFVDIYGDHEASGTTSGSNGTSTRPFLVQGRGGENNNMASPPLPMNHMEARNTTAASPEEDVPPPLPAKQGRRRQGAASPPSNLHDIREEEQALISILDELEKTVSRTPFVSVENRKEAATVVNRKGVQQDQVSGGSSEENLSAAEVRQRERDARRARIHSKVQTIKEHLKQQGDETTEAEWSIPWLLVGFIVMLGYCAYYVMQ